MNAVYAARVARNARHPLPPADPRHGTMNGYANLGCRCARCRAAIAAYYRKTRADPMARSRKARVERTRRRRWTIRPGSLRARQIADPAYLLPWHSPHVGGPWRLMLAVFSLKASAEMPRLGSARWPLWL